MQRSPPEEAEAKREVVEGWGVEACDEQIVRDREGWRRIIVVICIRERRTSGRTSTMRDLSEWLFTTGFGRWNGGTAEETAVFELCFARRFRVYLPNSTFGWLFDKRRPLVWTRWILSESALLILSQRRTSLSSWVPLRRQLTNNTRPDFRRNTLLKWFSFRYNLPVCVRTYKSLPEQRSAVNFS